MDIKKNIVELFYSSWSKVSTLPTRFLTNDRYRETQVITSILHVEFQGWIESDDPRRRPFKRDGGRGGAHGYLAASSGHFIRARRGGAAMTGHDDDFDSQTRTPITPGCYPRWLTSASLADRALAPPTMHYSVHTTFCWRICLFRNMIAAILFPVYPPPPADG